MHKDRFVNVDFIHIVQAHFSSINNISTGYCRLATIFFPALIRSEKVLRRSLIVKVECRTYGSIDPETI